MRVMCTDQRRAVRSRLRLRLRNDDRGAGPVTALLVLAILALVFALGFTALGAVAGSERSAAQHAADAAALAGAQEILDTAQEALATGFVEPSDIAGLLGGGTCVQVGRIEATRLAAANGASLTSYCYNVFADRVSAGVAMNSTDVSGPVAAAEAEAATTFDASSCRLDPSFTRPTPAPSATAPADEEEEEENNNPPPPAPPRATFVDCGTGPLAVTFSSALGRFSFDDLAGITIGLRPRLTA